MRNVSNKIMSLRKAEAVYGIPKSTILDCFWKGEVGSKCRTINCFDHGRRNKIGRLGC